MKKLIIIGIIAIVFIAGCNLFSSKGDNAETGKQSQMKTAKVERGNISQLISTTGTIEPLKVVEVSSKANGEIIRMPVKEGDYLNKGDLIAEIERTYAQDDVDQAKADLRSANARLEQAKISIKLEKKQRGIQVSQAEKNLQDAQTRLTQLEEQLKLEKDANVRKLAEAKNNLKIAKLQLKLSSSEGVRKEELKRAESSVTQSKANLDLVKKEFNRKRSLYEKGYISKSELDTAQQKLDTAEAQYESAQQQLEMVKNPATEDEIEVSQGNVEKAKFAIQAAQENIEAEKSSEREIEMQKNKIALMESNLELAKANLAQISMKEKDIETAQASVNRSKIQLENAQDRLEDTLVTAPLTGTILTKNVEEGQVISSKMSSVAAEGAPLVTMADLEKIYVNTDVDETDIGKVKAGQSVKITVDAFPNQVFDGEVLRIAPQGKVIQNVTTFEVITEIKSDTNILKPGMNAEVEIMVASANNVLLVPNEAILDVRENKMVRVVGEERPRRVETGVSNWEKTAIRSGLEEGETVIVGGEFKPGDSRTPRFLERMKEDPSSSIRMMQRDKRGGGPPPR